MLVEFTDPRLVAVYDTINAYEPDTQPRFVRELAAETGASTIVDLGCGTGLITRDLAGLGYAMIGVDPAPAMLAVARTRPNGDRVRWIEGGADAIDVTDADLAIMTGHVAQFFLTDESWSATLAALHGALRTGGRLAFESRNPAARAWEGWHGGARLVVHDPVAGEIETWVEGLGNTAGIVSYTIHYRFAAGGEQLRAPSALRFRTLDELRESLDQADFTVERATGDWDGRAAGPDAPELIVVARAR
jgi:SAM-dependent methyltransferase